MHYYNWWIPPYTQFIFLRQPFTNLKILTTENKNKRDDNFEAAAPTGKEIAWERNKINMICCRNAFSPTHGCVFAFFPTCHSLNIEKANMVTQLGRRVGVRKHGRVIGLQELQQRCQQKQQQKQGWIVVITQWLICPNWQNSGINHTWHQNGRSEVYDNIVKSCFACGDTF